MFTNKRYEQALVAFQRAGRTREAAICHAFFLREIARGVPDDLAREMEDAFIEAGEAFSVCAKEALSHQKKERSAYYTNAAECFVQGYRFKKAGDCFVHAEKYSEAACAYQEGGHFDEMTEVLEGHADQIEPNLHAQLMLVAQTNRSKVGKTVYHERLDD